MRIDKIFYSENEHLKIDSEKFVSDFLKILKSNNLEHNESHLKNMSLNDIYEYTLFVACLYFCENELSEFLSLMSQTITNQCKKYLNLDNCSDCNDFNKNKYEYIKQQIESLLLQIESLEPKKGKMPCH
ncbi:MAG: hypothetical protein E6R13_03925 [Spirochaetes bacterium]|nr:MAG: hypothetical protein E6R13_03925 [Spirochaetota bacterium]